MAKINNNQHITKDGVVKNNPRKLSADDKYFRDYFDERTKVNGSSEFQQRGQDVYTYDFTNKDIVKILQSLSPSDKRQVRAKMVQIDFANADMQDFIDFLMKGYTANQRGEQI